MIVSYSSDSVYLFDILADPSENPNVTALKGLLYNSIEPVHTKRKRIDSKVRTERPSKRSSSDELSPPLFQSATFTNQFDSTQETDIIHAPHSLYQLVYLHLGLTEDGILLSVVDAASALNNLHKLAKFPEPFCYVSPAYLATYTLALAHLKGVIVCQSFLNDFEFTWRPEEINELLENLQGLDSQDVVNLTYLETLSIWVRDLVRPQDSTFASWQPIKRPDTRPVLSDTNPYALDSQSLTYEAKDAVIQDASSMESETSRHEMHVARTETELEPPSNTPYPLEPPPRTRPGVEYELTVGDNGELEVAYTVPQSEAEASEAVMTEYNDNTTEHLRPLLEEEGESSDSDSESLDENDEETEPPANTRWAQRMSEMSLKKANIDAEVPIVHPVRSFSGHRNRDTVRDVGKFSFSCYYEHRNTLGQRRKFCLVS